MIYQNMLYSLRDISIIPSKITDIKSRTECNPFKETIIGNGENYLPLITAPMTCVIEDVNDSKEYIKNLINPIIPRTIPLETRLKLYHETFCAFSLKEAKFLLKEEDTESKRFVLIDTANGHMSEQLETGKKLKKYFKNIKIMGGNIANPETYILYNQYGFDYVRLGIGGGAGCLSSTQTGVHYAMASLLSDIYDFRVRHGYLGNGYCKVIADGGIGCYSDIIKCLALGADYVMMGKVFTKAAIGNQQVGEKVIYRGMSTKEEQVLMGNKKLKTSEGKSEEITKEYTLSGWTENFRDYLRSAMSYCDSKDLDEFAKKAECQVISPNTATKINDK